MPLERYIVGVLDQEVLPDWPLEALKAQAVASRTYALYRKEHPSQPEFDLEATTRDQLFSAKKNYPPPLIKAVEETTGEVLRYAGVILPAFFHSSCGGVSEKASALWPGVTPPPLNTIHEDPFCEASPRAHWIYEIPKELGGLQVLERSETGRVETILIEKDHQDEELSGNAFREKLGFDKVRSTLFDIEGEEGKLVLVGRGSGHGVGLCQWGAKEMAEQGRSYREILEFYYPGAEIGQIAL